MAAAAATPDLLDGVPLLDRYTELQLNSFKHRSRTPLRADQDPTLLHIYHREAPGKSLPRTKAVAVRLILELQLRRLALLSGGAKDTDDESSDGGDGDGADERLGAEARAASRLAAAASKGDAPASGAGEQTPPSTPPRAKAAAPSLRLAAVSPGSAPASPFEDITKDVLGADLKRLRRMANELELGFLDTTRLSEMRELVLLGKAGFKWDQAAKLSSDTPNPYTTFGDGVELSLLVRLRGPTPKQLVHAEINLMLADPKVSDEDGSRGRGRAKGTKNTATRIRDCIVRLLDRMVAKRDGTEVPGGERDGVGTPAGGTRPLAAMVSPDSAAPKLRTQLSRGCLDRVPPVATIDSPRAGKTVRVGSWNLRRFSCSSLSMRDVKDMVERLWRFDVVVLLEVFSGPHGTAEEAVQKLCEKLDVRSSRPGAWGFILSPEDETASAAAGAAAAGKGAAGGERAAMIWRRDSAVCTSVQAGTDIEAGHCISFKDEGSAYQPACKYFARPPMVASFRCGELDFVVVGYHAVWDRKSGWKQRGDAARKIEFANLAVAISTLRQRMSEAAEDLKDTHPPQARCLKWAPILVCGDFNAEILNPAQHALFNPLMHVGGECLHSTGEPTVIATEEAKASAFDMVWMFPALATVEATCRMLEASLAEEEEEDKRAEMAEAAATPAAAESHAVATRDPLEIDVDADKKPATSEAPEEDAFMVEVASYGIDDIMGKIRGRLTEEGSALATGAPPSLTVKPRPEALKAVGDAMALLGIPFAAAAAHDPELQAKALVSFARSMVSMSLSDHCPVWVELLPVRMPVGTASQVAGRLDDAISRCTVEGGVETAKGPRLTSLPVAAVGAKVSGGLDADGNDRFVSGTMFTS